MRRVFLDADVLFTAAHNSRGKAAFVIEPNLVAKCPDALPRLVALLGGIASVTADSSAPSPEGLAARDAVIFRAAPTCRATHLLTGDLQRSGPFMNQPAVT